MGQWAALKQLLPAEPYDLTTKSIQDNEVGRRSSVNLQAYKHTSIQAHKHAAGHAMSSRLQPGLNVDSYC